MGRLKRPDTITKISKEKAVETKCFPQPAFSFAHLTTSKKYCLKGIPNKDKNGNSVALQLILHLSEMSSLAWAEITKEKMHVGRLKFRPSNRIVSEDEKFTSIRFGQQNCRLIGQKADSCSIFYIWGFDFDYSAYNHGS